MATSTLRDKLIKLGNHHPELRPHLAPILKKNASNQKHLGWHELMKRAADADEKFLLHALQKALNGIDPEPLSDVVVFVDPSDKFSETLKSDTRDGIFSNSIRVFDLGGHLVEGFNEDEENQRPTLKASFNLAKFGGLFAIGVYTRLGNRFANTAYLSRKHWNKLFPEDAIWNAKEMELQQKAEVSSGSVSKLNSYIQKLKSEGPELVGLLLATQDKKLPEFFKQRGLGNPSEKNESYKLTNPVIRFLMDSQYLVKVSKFRLGVAPRGQEILENQVVRIASRQKNAGVRKLATEQDLPWASLPKTVTGPIEDLWLAETPSNVPVHVAENDVAEFEISIHRGDDEEVAGYLVERGQIVKQYQLKRNGVKPVKVRLGPGQALVQLYTGMGDNYVSHVFVSRAIWNTLVPRDQQIWDTKELAEQGKQEEHGRGNRNQGKVSELVDRGHKATITRLLNTFALKATDMKILWLKEGWGEPFAWGKGVYGAPLNFIITALWKKGLIERKIKTFKVSRKGAAFLEG